MVENDEILNELKKLGEKVDANTAEISQFYTTFANEILRLKFNLQILEQEVRSNKKE